MCVCVCLAGGRGGGYYPGIDADNMSNSSFFLKKNTQKNMVTANFKSVIVILLKKRTNLRATSHTRMRACDHYASSTLIGGKGGAGPHLLHITLEGPMEHVNVRCM